MRERSEIEADLALTIDHHGDLDMDWAADRLIADLLPLLQRLDEQTVRAEAAEARVRELETALDGAE